ncbi:MAG TPA: hypothetical protein VFU71_11795 [Burkholderiaceae bacterium]|nr:hypothetical protein [Burkholderiaceae bacterium]
MTTQPDIPAFMLRIAQSEAKRDAWRAAGNREKYLEAYFEVEGMELLLERQLRQDAARDPDAVEAPDNCQNQACR